MGGKNRVIRTFFSQRWFYRLEMGVYFQMGQKKHFRNGVQVSTKKGGFSLKKGLLGPAGRHTLIHPKRDL